MRMMTLKKMTMTKKMMKMVTRMMESENIHLGLHLLAFAALLTACVKWSTVVDKLSLR